MPLYEYKCTKCGTTQEVIQKVADPPLDQCGKCGGPVKKVVSCPAIQFKGSGWYVTDYAAKGRGKSESAPKTAATPGKQASNGGKQAADKSTAKPATPVS